ncbi:hypothetical protein CJF30_00009494 [Rutstroemia sp. NJR-2017a BBW]|nr:hypothetical protein CJF30_00009494 [Rutstroemia sp. NJR-2017a BBW]
MQRLAHTAQISFAEHTLLHDQNQMLTRMTNEAKVRKSTKLVVLGKVKVMSFEDIQLARAARATKDAMKGKGKRGRKRKSATLEAEEVITGKKKRGRKRKSAVQESDEPGPEQGLTQTIEAPEP